METALPETHIPEPHADDDTTRATAHLPGLDIEVVHRRAPGAEQISVHVQATPSFEAFGRFVESANPFAFWAEATRLAWLPWLTLFGAAQTLTSLGSARDAPRKLTRS